MNLLDGTTFGGASGFASTVTILPLFIASLTTSTALVGLIGSIQALGWQLPQLFTARRVARQERYKPMLLWMTIHERWPFLGLSLIALLIPFISKELALALVFVLYSCQAFGAGLTATPWQSMLGKVMPEQWRGRFFGMLFSGNNLMAAISALIAGYLLQKVAYPLNFAFCFFLAALFTLISFLFLAATREPAIPPPEEIANDTAFWSGLWDILKRDGNFRWFLAARIVIQFGMIGLGFYTVYATRHFHVGPETIGVMTGILLIAQMLVNPLIGWLGDHWGHRFVIAAGMLSMALSSLLVLLAPDATWMYPAFALAAVGSAVSITSILAMTVEFGDEHERPYYIGLGNTLIAPVSMLAPLIGGAMADSLGYDATFKLACGSAVLGICILLFLLRDPRALRQVAPALAAAPAEAG